MLSSNHIPSAVICQPTESKLVLKNTVKQTKTCRKATCSFTIYTKQSLVSNTCTYPFSSLSTAQNTASIYLQESKVQMGSILSSNKDKEKVNMALSKAKQIVSSNPVVVFSKTYCGYCQRVKQLLSQLNAAYKVIELDEESDGDDIQAALADWTGQRTVPNVFIGGKHIGGCDSTLQKHQKGELVPMLTAAGAIANNSAQL